MEGIWLQVILSLAIGGGILLLLVVLFLTRHNKSVRKTSNFTCDGDQQKVVAGLIAEVLPVHPNSGWSLQGIYNGVRLFTRQLDSLQRYSSSKQISAASLIVDVTLKRALSLVSSVRELPCWMFGVPSSNCSPPSLVSQLSASSHLIRFTMLQQPQTGLVRRVLWNTHFKVSSAISKYAPSLEGRVVSTPHRIKTETLEKFWHYEESGLCYMFSHPRQPSSLPYLWSCICFTPLKQSGMCLATLVMCPAPGASVNQLITGQLCALREHITMRAFKVYSWYHPNRSSNRPAKESSQRESTEPKVLSEGEVSARHSQGEEGGSSVQATKSEKLDTVVPSSLQSEDRFTTPLPSVTVATPLPPPPEETPDMRYLSMAEQWTNNLVTMAEEGAAEGWLEVGIFKNVHVTKKLPKENEPPINNVRGVGNVAVPPEFLLRVLLDPAHTTTLDDLLKETRLLQEISPAVSLVHLLYKGVWPTSPRDLSLLTISGQVDARTWISSGNSVEDDRIPLEKGFVRAELLQGGYLIHSIPDKSEMSEVTYAAGINLKGNIPAFAVNKIAESQPMCINRLRKLAEPLYNKLKADPPALAAFEQKFPIAQVIPRKEQLPNSSPAPDDALVEESVVASPNGLVPASPNGLVPASPNGLVPASPNGLVPASPNGLVDTSPDDLVGVGVLANGSPTATSLTGLSEEPVAISASAEPLASSHGTSSLEDRLAQTQWHFDPSSNPSDDIPPLTTSQQAGLEDSTDGRFKTPPMSSDEEGEGSEQRKDVQDTSVNSEVITGPDSASVYTATSEEVREQPSVRSAPNTALQLSQYMPPSNVEDSAFQSITKENIYYPRHDSGQVDFRTLANQTAARVLEEVFHVSNIDLLSPSTFQLTGGWSFAGLEKEVLLLSKSTPDQPFSSFMGKGIIPLSPQSVFDSLRNPQLRFMYDNMLKELHIVRHIEEGLFILHLQHETTQCFIKQARDFCILVSERCEPNKKMLTGFSIETPDCPPNPNLHRGKIHYSGWVVEPKEVKGKMWAEVTYLLQVDVGGVPGPLINMISKRQPLAVAYLRDYLVSTSFEHSNELQ